VSVSPSHSQTEPFEGSLVGSYRIVRQIGQGGMGAVWLAEHTMLGRRAALKTLHPEFTTVPEVVARFFNEARSATAIADPGIVQIFDFGYHSDTSAYIVMELLEGESLDARLTRLGVLPVADAVRIMRQVASTLGAAHAQGIVHRDLKPENIMIVRDPEVLRGERAKVLDFGIAKLAGDRPVGVQTVATAVFGTPAYMSPEQCRGAGLVDQRSDVYALGCVLFRLLCGRTPFEAEGMGAMFAMHLRESPPAPSTLRPGLPREIDQLILRCLDKDPQRRFASGHELALALQALHTGAPQLAAPSVPPAPPSAPTTLSAAASSAVASRTRVRARHGVLAVTVLGFAAAGAAVAMLGGHSSAEPQPAAPTPPPPPPPPTPIAPTPDPNAALAANMTGVIDRFVAWSHDHAGEPCPNVASLGKVPDDPWHHAFRLTCTDQPGNQMIGVISAGPDGIPNTSDDVASWQLARAVTEPLRGPRWVAAPPPTPAAKPQVSHAHGSGSPPASRSLPPKTIELDDSGLPVNR
jgi:serine/threonine-protein kinase